MSIVRKQTWGITLAAIVLFVSSASGTASDTGGDGVIRIGTEPTFPPYEFRLEDGTIAGYDIDLVRMAAEKTGLRIKIVSMAFDALIPSLTEGRIDLIAAAMEITPERVKRVAFTDTYRSSGDAFVTRTGENWARYPDDLGGRTAAVQMGTVQDRFVTAMDQVIVRRFEKTDQALSDLLEGTSDVVVMDTEVARSYLHKDQRFRDTLKIAFAVETERSGIAFAVRKNDTWLLDSMNRALDILREEGALSRLEERWFAY